MRRLLAVLLVFALLACGDSASRPPAVPETVRASFDDYTIDDLARYVAGKPEGLPKRFAPLTATPGYRSLSRRMDTAWARYERDHLSKIRAWRSELGGKYTDEVFYPFGGPDAIHGLSLFPDARRFTLFGLERFGRLPVPPFQAPGDAATQVNAVHGAVRGVLGRNFFLTLTMTATVGGAPDNGVAAILLLLLARLDQEILDAYPIALTAVGNVVFAESDSKAQGVRVLFRGRDGIVREMNYFQLNLSDANLPRTPGLRAYLEKRRDVTTLLKAASYLMYLDAFDDVRGMILNRSRLIVSDPSGMPFHFMRKPGLRLTPYGRYAGPIGLFRIRYEPDRFAFYRRTGGRPLPFAYGYHPTSPNLIVAEREGVGESRPLVFDGHDTEGVTTFFRDGRQVILGRRPDQSVVKE